MRLPRPRLPRRFRFHWSMLAVFPAAAVLALTLIVVDPYGAGHPSDGEETHTARRARVPHGQPTRFGADCRTRTQGSQAVAYCHNPYPEPDRVRLHIECARWWDIDSDGPPVEAGPAMTVRLTGRCWKEIGSVWVSHQQ